MNTESKTKTYKFLGKQVQRFSIGKKDYCLITGNEVSLPVADNHVKRLIAKGKLKEVKTNKSK